MPQIENLEDVLNELADKIGIYGCCKATSEDGCDNESVFCCRVGFMMLWEDKIRAAIENENKLSSIGL